MKVRASLCVAALWALFASRAEIGIDGSLTTTLGSDPRFTVLRLPEAALRVGFFLSNSISLEPKLALLTSTADGQTDIHYDGTVSLLFHFTSQPVGSGVYLRPFIGLGGSSGGGYSNSAVRAGAGLGGSIRFANRLATRLEGNFNHVFIDGVPANTVGANVGLSFFTR